MYGTNKKNPDNLELPNIAEDRRSCAYVCVGVGGGKGLSLFYSRGYKVDCAGYISIKS